MTKQGNNYFKDPWAILAICFLLFVLIACGVGVSWWIPGIGIPAFAALFILMQNNP